MKIGGVARAAGVNVQTVRFYERCGLISLPPRLSSGYRDYPAKTVQRVVGIKRAQKLGFTLSEIRELMRLEEPGLHIEHVHTVAASKITEINEKIEALKRLRKSLRTLLKSAEQGAERCPVLEENPRRS
jgi:DNA-binding transcriptional MerR regulator